MSLIEIVGIVTAVLVLLAVILILFSLKRRAGADLSPLQTRLDSLEKGQERGARELRDEFARNRDETAGQSSVLRQEVETSLKGVSDSVTQLIIGQTQVQQGQMDTFGDRLGKMVEANEKKSDALREAVEQKLTQIQANNDAKLEEMRKTVDEKLQSTLDKRLGDSFKLVSDSLEMVHKGLGEMQSLAGEVGGLKKILSNVKTRGTWGEMQLGNLLDQILTADQYEKNVCTKAGSAERVEFAIKLPGRGEGGDGPVWLPIDAKFPREDYERLIDASERADAAAVEEFSKQLEARIKLEAKAIRDKYLDPPQTTDFGLLYLPTEGLYAEVLRRPGLTDILQREFRVSVAGPTTLLAILNSLQMGFQSLAIEKRSAEIRDLLGAVKTEFGTFGAWIERVHKKIQAAETEIGKAKTRTNAIERKLRSVAGLPAAKASLLLAEAEAEAEDGESEPGGGEEPTA